MLRGGQAVSLAALFVPQAEVLEILLMQLLISSYDSAISNCATLSSGKGRKEWQDEICRDGGVLSHQ